MGLLGGLIDEIVDATVKAVEAPFRVIDRVLCGHEWDRWQRIDGRLIRHCRVCYATETSR